MAAAAAFENVVIDFALGARGYNRSTCACFRCLSRIGWTPRPRKRFWLLAFGTHMILKKSTRSQTRKIANPPPPGRASSPPQNVPPYRALRQPKPKPINYGYCMFFVPTKTSAYVPAIYTNEPNRTEPLFPTDLISINVTYEWRSILVFRAL